MRFLIIICQTPWFSIHYKISNRTMHTFSSFLFLSFPSFYSFLFLSPCLSVFMCLCRCLSLFPSYPLTSLSHIPIPPFPHTPHRFRSYLSISNSTIHFSFLLCSFHHLSLPLHHITVTPSPPSTSLILSLSLCVSSIPFFLLTLYLIKLLLKFTNPEFFSSSSPFHWSHSCIISLLQPPVACLGGRPVLCLWPEVNVVPQIDSPRQRVRDSWRYDHTQRPDITLIRPLTRLKVSRMFPPSMLSPNVIRNLMKKIPAQTSSHGMKVWSKSWC